MKSSDWGWMALAVLALVVAPLAFSAHTLTLLLIYAMLALSLGLVWGFGGILCFGQAAFYGLGAYAYAVAAVNIGESTVPLLLALLLPALLAAVLGAMMFYGRISDVYMGVITLVVTLILFKFMSATAGDAYRIGSARLGGFNGIPAFPILNLPGDTSVQIFGTPFYYLVAVLVLACYLLCRRILGSFFGQVAVFVLLFSGPFLVLVLLGLIGHCAALLLGVPVPSDSPLALLQVGGKRPQQP